MAAAIVDVGSLSRNWWAFLIRGIAGILFGLFTFVSPGVTLVALALTLAVWLVADGALAIAAAIRRRGEDRWGMLLLQGIAGVAAGLIAAAWPGITALALVSLIAVWAIVRGALEIAVAIRLRKVMRNEWMLILAGIASILLGGLLLASPGTGALAVVVWIGVYALVSGILLVGLALRLRGRQSVMAPRVQER